MSFGAPSLLIGLLVVPLAVAGYWLLERRRSRKSEAWSNQALLPSATRRPARRLRHLPAVLLLVGLTFVLLGTARPERSLTKDSVNAATIVMAMDVSGSMAATDVKPNRVLAARAIAMRLVKTIPRRYRLAVVTFGNRVRLAVAPTLDRRRVLAGLPRKVTPLAGTAIGTAVNEAVAVAGRGGGEGSGRQRKPGAVLLLSDGAQTAGGTTEQAAALTARVSGIAINAVPIGTERGIVAQTTKQNGVKATTQLPAPVDTRALRMLSRASGGVFFGRPSAIDTAQIYKDLRAGGTLDARKHELSAAAGVAGLVFILGGTVLGGLWFGRVI